MKLASFRHDGKNRIGVRLRDDAVAVIGSRESDRAAPAMTMLDLIRLGDRGLDHARKAFENEASFTILDPAGLDWLPPVPDPGKVCGVAMNNSASNERKISAPDHPAFFLKPATCLIGHGQPIRIRRYYGSVHPEPELAVIIGRETRDVDAADAMDSVYGYTIFNDVTGNGMRADDLFHYWALYADDDQSGKLERREQHLSYAARYKGADTFGCMGPWLVTADEIPDPDNLNVYCRVGGESIAEDSTRFYNYRVAEIISYLSQFQTLMPGDILSCGTAFKPSPGRRSIHHANFQHVPGPVEVSIDGLGTLCNPVIIEDKPLGQWRLRRPADSQE